MCPAILRNTGLAFKNEGKKKQKYLLVFQSQKNSIINDTILMNQNRLLFFLIKRYAKPTNKRHQS